MCVAKGYDSISYSLYITRYSWGFSMKSLRPDGTDMFQWTVSSVDHNHNLQQNTTKHSREQFTEPYLVTLLHAEWLQ